MPNTFGQVPPPPLPSGVPNDYIAYYPFNVDISTPINSWNNQAKLDHGPNDGNNCWTSGTSVNWKDAIINTNVTTGASGILGTCIEMDGTINPAVEFTNGSSCSNSLQMNALNYYMDEHKDFTVSFWIKDDDNHSQGSAISESIFRRRDNCNGNGDPNTVFMDIRAVLHRVTGSPTLGAEMTEHQNSSGFNYLINNSVSSSIAQNCSDWYHVVVTRNVYGVAGIPPISATNNWSITRLFINGIKVDETSEWAVDISRNQTSNFEISGSSCIGPIWPSYNTMPFSGSFDELLLYDRELAEIEIQQMYDGYTGGAFAAQVGDVTICLGNSATLTVNVIGGAGQSTDFLWSTSATTQSITVSPTQTTTYTVNVVQGACSIPIQTTVSVINPPQLNPSSSIEICDGDIGTLNVSPVQSANTTYQWGTLNPSQVLQGETGSSLSVSPSVNRAYYVEVTNGNGCSSPQFYAVLVNPVPTVGIDGPTEVCGNDPVTFKVNPIEADVNYSWLFTGGAFFINQTSVTTNLLVNPTIANIIATNDYGCTTTTSVSVTYNPSCCPVAEDPNYLAIWRENISVLNTYGITFNNAGTIATINDGQFHTLPDRLFVPDGITFRVSNSGTVLDLTNTDMVFGECAELEIYDEATLIAYNSVFRNCNPSVSWNGIEIYQANSNTSLKECTILGADIGIDIRGNNSGALVSDIAIQNNLFSNNRIGVNTVDFASSKQISGNTFQLDSPDQISYLDTDCNPISENSSFIGVQISRGKGDALIRLSQNDFINGTGSDNEATFIGISVLEQSTNLSVSGNHFTDMYRSIDINNIGGLGSHIAQPIVIENNNIEVTRDFGARDRGNYQIRIDQAAYVEVINNEIYSSAEAFPINIDLFDNKPFAIGSYFMNDAIFVTGERNTLFSQGIIRDNEILGFEVGIHAVNTDRIRISENEIKTQYYGIFAFHNGVVDITEAEMISIKCNNIEMDFERSTSAVGIAFHLPMKGETDEKHFIVGNCIKNTHRAIEVIQRDFLDPSNFNGDEVAMPIIKNNFLYNYVDAGILINGIKITGEIGQQGEPGYNTFFGNNVPAIGANLDYYVQNNVPINAWGNDYGVAGARLLWAGAPFSVNGPNVGSFATCANQDENNNVDFQQLEESSTYFCGDDIGFNFQGLITGFSKKDAPIEVWNELVTKSEDDGHLNTALQLLSRLDNPIKRNTFVQYVLNSTQLNTEELAWFRFNTYLIEEDLVNARQVLTGITPQGEERNAKKELSSILLNLKENNLTIQELSSIDIEKLKHFSESELKIANVANLLLQSIGKNKAVLNFKLPLLKIEDIDKNRIEEVNASLIVYPNPSYDQVFLEYDISQIGEGSVIEIYNMLGMKVFSETIQVSATNKYPINILKFTPGAYNVVLLDNSGILKKGRFVKK